MKSENLISRVLKPPSKRCQKKRPLSLNDAVFLTTHESNGLKQVILSVPCTKLDQSLPHLGASLPCRDTVTLRFKHHCRDRIGQGCFVAGQKPERAALVWDPTCITKIL